MHLTWIGRTELDARYPRVEYDGTFDGFMAYEKANWGPEPPEGDPKRKTRPPRETAALTE